MKNRRKLFCNFIQDYLVLTYPSIRSILYLLKMNSRALMGNDKSSKRVGYKNCLKNIRIPT
jgi:hypothetical protein